MGSATRRVTITDVARHAGVSPAAVSKVLRGASGVSAAMEDKVRAAMAELEYRPHAAARGMRGKTYTLGVVLDNIRNPFFADILDGAGDEVHATDYQILVGAGGFGSAGQSALADAMVDRRMDGLILIAPGIDRSGVVRTAGQVPLVVIGHHDTDGAYDSVVDDDVAGAALAVDHLVGLGHRRIAHTSTTGTRKSGWSRTPDRVRSQGYREAMRRHGLGEHIDVAVTSFSEQGGYEAAKELLGRPCPPTAIFAGADVAALGVFRAADELGLEIPRDLSLVGYDNTTSAALSPVQLTTVDQAGRTMGSTAARLLLERVNGRTTSVRVAGSPTLIVRRTTATPRTAHGAARVSGG